MVQNIDSILQRGERLDLLVDKTDTLAGQAYAFRRGARSVRRAQWWKNTRITVLTGVVVVVSPVLSVIGIHLLFDESVRDASKVAVGERTFDECPWRDSWLGKNGRTIGHGFTDMHHQNQRQDTDSIAHHLLLHRPVLRSIAIALLFEIAIQFGMTSRPSMSLS